MSVAQIDGQPTAVYRWCSAWGGLACGMVLPDALTAERVAESTGVSVAEARAILGQGRESVL